MKTIKEVLEPIKMPDNVIMGGYEKNRPLINIPKNANYIEILGYKLYGEFDSFQSFVDYLKSVSDTEKENERLKKEIDEYENRKAYLIEYLTDRLEEAKLDAQYYDGMRFANYKETIYEDLLDIVEGKYEKTHSNS